MDVVQNGLGSSRATEEGVEVELGVLLDSPQCDEGDPTFTVVVTNFHDVRLRLNEQMPEWMRGCVNAVRVRRVGTETFSPSKTLEELLEQAQAA